MYIWGVGKDLPQIRQGKIIMDFIQCHSQLFKSYIFWPFPAKLIQQNTWANQFAGITGRSLVQKIPKNINNLISSRLSTKLCWTDKNTKNLVLLGKNAHAQKVPQDNH